MELTIRQETDKDFPAVFKLIEEAFESEIQSEHKEHFLVEHLRNSKSFIPELSLVAELQKNIVGHILLTRIKIKNNNQQFDALALAPVSVHPKHQRKGIGSKLIEAAHNKAAKLGFNSVVVLGHSSYYPKFGYKQAHQYGIEFPFEAPKENCMMKELINGSLQRVNGTVIYPKEFYD